MDFPIKFPDDADVVYEEAARFRALSPEERLRVIRDLLSTGAMLMRQSPKAEFLQKHTEEQEELYKKAVKEFIARHAH